MQKTVRELLEMYKTRRPLNGAENSIYTEQSTQRGYIYRDIIDVRTGRSKAAEVITSMIERRIKLNGLYFWNVQDDIANIHYLENEYNITDGKQRFLSIYNFYRGNLVACIGGREVCYDELSNEQKEQFLNYTFDITLGVGTLKEEETTFYYINTSSEPLTNYEGLRGAYHGQFINSFEDYVNAKANIKTKINKISDGRGEQAAWLLYLYFDVYNLNREGELDTKDTNIKVLVERTRNALSLVRTTNFNPNHNNFERKLFLYNELCIKFDRCKDHSPQKLYKIAKYVIDKGYNTAVVLAYYEELVNQVNDVRKWDFGIHKTAIEALFSTPSKRLHGLRFFPDDIRQTLYTRNCHCVQCSKELGYKESTVDHILAWSNGGRTTLDNAQLMCSSCNSAKNNN